MLNTAVGAEYEFMSQAEYARARGKSQQAVAYHLKRGRISLTTDGLVDVAEADTSLGWRDDPDVLRRALEHRASLRSSFTIRLGDQQCRSHVYFIRCDRYMKIGASYNPKRRLSSLQTGNPFPMSLEAVAQYAGIIGEQEFHARFAAQHHQGEWFHIEGRLLRALPYIRKAHPVDMFFNPQSWRNR